MSETVERTGQLKKEVAEIVRVQKAMLEAIKEIEKERGTEFMPAGEYHGYHFE